MSEWKTYKLTDICNLVAGFAFKSRDFGSYKDKVIKIANINPPIVDIQSLLGVDMTMYSLDRLEKYKVTKGDYVFAMTGATIGKLGIVRDDIEAYINQRVLTFRPNKDIIDKQYLWYILNTYTFEKYILNHIDSDTAQPNISAMSVGGFEISLPPLSEQKRIAGILSALDDKIELNRRINANLEAQAMALYKHWFVDFEFPNSAEKPYKSSGGKMIDSDFGPIPAGWHIGKVNDLGIIICGKTPSKAIAANYGDAIPFIKIPDMHNHVFVHKSDEMLSIVGSDSQIKKLLPPYSVLVSCIATVGLVSMNVVPSHTNQQINSVIPNDVIYRYYLYLMFKNMALDLQNYGRGGTATLNVNTSTFANIKVLLPSRQILEWFYLRIQSMFELIRYNQEEIYNLSSIRNALLHKLIREEIKM